MRTQRYQPTPEELADRALADAPREGVCGVEVAACDELGRYAVAVLDFTPPPDETDWETLVEFRDTSVGADPVLTPMPSPEYPGRAALILSHPTKMPRLFMPDEAAQWIRSSHTMPRLKAQIGRLTTRWTEMNTPGQE